MTKAGALWRWDGLVAAADAPSAAAERLAQKNRLAELEAELADVRTERNSRRADAAARGIALETARSVEREKREGWRRAQHAIGQAQAAVDAAQRAIGELTTRQSALEEARVRLDASLGEAETAAAEAAKGLAEAGDEAAAPP